MTLSRRFRIKPGSTLKLADVATDTTYGFSKGAELDAALARNIARLDELQYVMYAERRHALLVILQGIARRMGADLSRIKLE